MKESGAYQRIGKALQLSYKKIQISPTHHKKIGRRIIGRQRAVGMGKFFVHPGLIRPSPLEKNISKKESESLLQKTSQLADKPF